MKYEIEIWLVTGAVLRDTIETREDVDPQEAATGSWKYPVRVTVERIAEGYHRASDSYPSLPHTYYPPHSIRSITYREARE